jgi:toxin ParE1/3/4
MEFKLSLKAEIDLIEIWEYTFQTWSIEKANQYVANLISSINNLCRNPKIEKNYQVSVFLPVKYFKYRKPKINPK